MSKQLGSARTILDTTGADVAQGSASWYSVDTADQCILSVAISGSVTVYIDVDVGSSDFATFSYTATTMVVLDDPAKRIRAYTSGCSGVETAVVKLYEAFEQER